MLPIPGGFGSSWRYPAAGDGGVGDARHAGAGGRFGAVKSGNVLIINGERVGVGEACNGMRLVFALALVVYAFAFGTPLKPATRLILLALSARGGDGVQRHPARADESDFRVRQPLGGRGVPRLGRLGHASGGAVHPDRRAEDDSLARIPCDLIPAGESMTSFQTILRRISAFAPLATLCALPLFALWLPNRVAIDEQTVARQKEVADAMAAVPYFIGDRDQWIGQDAEVPREAQALLRPNATLSRTYQRPGGERLHLLVVHCSDMRDMQGHYPPICYPSSGWVPEPVDGADDVDLTVDELPMPVRTYCFRLVREGGIEEQIRIFNTFILPGGVVSREMSDLREQTERLAVSVQGVAQMQIISSMSMSYDDAIQAANDLLTDVPALFDALGVGSEEGSGELMNGDVNKTTSRCSRPRLWGAGASTGVGMRARRGPGAVAAVIVERHRRPAAGTVDLDGDHRRPAGGGLRRAGVSVDGAEIRKYGHDPHRAAGRHDALQGA
jgi:hypothetical protein